MNCFFVSDIHGKINRYLSLFNEIERELPEYVFIGGDILPHQMHFQKYNNKTIENFILDFLIPKFQELKIKLKDNYPEIFLILGNDDHRVEETFVLEGDSLGIWKYIHNKTVKIKDYTISGYSFIPPTPFQLKDWEKYDVSRYVDPGSTPPTTGSRSIDPDYNPEYSTIKKDLETFFSKLDSDKAILLFHSPPYKTNLDRAALDGQKVDHVPLDVHVGSIAIMRYIEEFQPFLTLHGHIHESTSITGQFKQQFGKTWAFNAANDTQQLSIIKFDLENPDNAKRVLI
jgi:Icc-related predicted phosphoesterase